MTEIQGKSILFRVSARFKLARGCCLSYRESTLVTSFFCCAKQVESGWTGIGTDNHFPTFCKAVNLCFS